MIKTGNSRLMLRLITSLFSSLALSSPSWATEYTITDLGTLGGSTSYAAGIHASGQVVGYHSAGNGPDHAFLYSNGTMSDLVTLGGNQRLAMGINDNGQIAGYSDSW